MQIDNNCILISIQPKWAQLIGNGKKHIELRKNIPNLKPPFKCYIYCTKAHYLIDRKFINSFDTNPCIESYSEDIRYLWPCDGKVIGEFICNSIEELNEKAIFEGMDEISNSRIEDLSCVPIDDILSYKGDKEIIYGWNISDCRIYKKPLDLDRFYQTKVIRGYHKNKLRDDVNIDIDYLLKSKRLEVKRFERPPQSWCYCDELSEG